MTTYISNAFSINMLSTGEQQTLRFLPLTLPTATAIATNGVQSIIGHADTATVISNQLGIDLPENRVSITLDFSQDQLLVAQYIGPRLPIGATQLPDGATLNWWLVERVESEA